MPDLERGIRNRAVRFEHLGEALVAGNQIATLTAQPGIRVTDQGGDVICPRAQSRVDRRIELRAIAKIDEEPDTAEHHRHRYGEGESYPQPDREPLQRPPSFRSR